MVPLNFGKVGVFIDGENIRNALEASGWKPDYEKLLQWIAEKTKCSIVKPFFYIKEEEDPSEPKKGFIKKLKTLEVTIRNVPVSQKFIQQNLVNICDADPLIITDMMDWKNDYDKVVLISGDGAFAIPLQRLWEHGKKIYVVSTNQSVSGKLENNPNFNFIDLNDIRNIIELIFL